MAETDHGVPSSIVLVQTMIPRSGELWSTATIDSTIVSHRNHRGSLLLD